VRKYLLVAFAFSFILFESHGQSSAPKFSNEFMSIGVGSRALGMANTQVSFGDDVTMGYWNPAGMVDIKQKYAGAFMHAEYFAGIAQFDYLAFATPIDSSSHIGVSLIRFGVDDIPDTRFLYDANGQLNYDNINFFSAADYAFLISYARKIHAIKGLSVGANVKVIHRRAGEFATAWGFGLDAGVRYNYRKWNFGIMVRDITGTYNAWSHEPELLEEVFTQTGNEIPVNSVEITLPKMLLEASRYFSLPKNLGIRPALALDFTFDGKRNVLIKTDVMSIDPKLGVEIDYKQMFFLRGGVRNFQEVKDFDGSTSMEFQPDFGVGFRLKNVGLDYALTDIGNQSSALFSHVFTLLVYVD
jgi:hypothetical protein